MTKKIKILLLISLFLIINLLTITTKIQAAIPSPDLRKEIIENELTPTAETFGGYANSKPTSILNTIALTVNSLLSLLGILFLVLIIISGYQWMTAGGNEEVITTAKNRIKNATIGLAIVLFSYAISYYVFQLIYASSTGASITL